MSTRQNGNVGAVGLVSLKSLLRAAADERGLDLAFPKLLSFGHRPLVIPWSELHVLSDKTLFGLRMIQLQAGEPRIARIYLRGGIAAAVSEHASVK